MPTALQSSRDFMARGLARLRAGVGDTYKRAGQEGPAIHIDPFKAGNVSTPAAMVKLASTILAARRARANYDASQEDAALKRDMTRAQIAHLRAQAAYDQGTGRQPVGPRARAQVTTPVQIGRLAPGTYDPAVITAEGNVIRTNATSGRAADAAGRQQNAQERLDAQANLKALDQSAKNDIQLHTDAEMRRRTQIDDNRLASSDPEVVKAMLKDYGISDPGSTPLEKLAVRKAVAAMLAERVKSMVTKNINTYYAPKRARYEAVLNGAAPSDAAAGAAAPAAPAAPTGGGDTVIQYDQQGNQIPAGP